MTHHSSVKDLVKALKLDEWRKIRPFSEDVRRVNDVLWDPYSEEPDISDAIMLWLQAARPPNQPCLFGRFAAAQRRIHLCTLTDADLFSSDENIAETIKRERHLWKLGCLRHEVPKEGFLLLVASERIARASPDENLLRLARRIRDLGWTDVQPDELGNDVTWETLYLRNPAQNSHVRFTFSLDFFGAQGDGRWWHDHRIPGGIGYTANSAGYLVRSREWYDMKRGSEIEFVLKVAMETVDEAATTEWGRAIWLEELRDWQPMRPGSCPFQDPSALKERLRGKDWSVYGGLLSTDHSVRAELFRAAPEVPDVLRTKWLQDFTYLYDPSVADHRKFIEGEPVSEEDVFRELGTPDKWRVSPLARAVKQARRFAKEAFASSADRLRSIGWRYSERTESRKRIAAALASMRADWAAHQS